MFFTVSENDEDFVGFSVKANIMVLSVGDLGVVCGKLPHFQ